MEWFYIVLIIIFFIIMLVAWGTIISKTGYSWANVLLLLVPGVNIIFILYLAFSTWPNMRVRVCTKCNKLFGIDDLFCSECGSETDLFILPSEDDIEISEKKQLIEIGKKSYPVLAVFDDLREKIERIDVRLDKSELARFDPLLKELKESIEKGEAGWHTKAGVEIRDSLAVLLLEKGREFSSHIGNKEKAIEFYSLALKIVDTIETKKNIISAMREADNQCKKCGKRLGSNQEYCSGCGSKITQ